MSVEWSDEAIVLAARPHGEADLVVQLLTRQRGRHAGLAKGGQSKRQRGLHEPGTRVVATWKARLADHLGYLSTEPRGSALGALLDRPGPLGALASALAVAERALPEREPHPAAYDGLDALLSALPAEKLSHLWLFSSVAGLFGNIGQSDYAMANELLNRIAARHRRHHPQCHALSINWGAWNAGMVTPEVKAVFAQRGVRLIEVEQGEALFADALTQAPPQYGVLLAGAPMPLADRHDPPRPGRQWRARRGTAALAASPLLRDHRIGDVPVLPAAFAFGWIAHVAERALVGHALAGCRNFQVLHGLVADRELAPECDVRLECVEVRADGGVVLDATLLAAGSGRPHYRAQGLLLAPRGARAAVRVPSLALDALRDASRLYADGTLFHGPQFQLLREYAPVGERRLAFVCRRPPGDAPRLLSSHSATDYCPMVGDALLQAALAWVAQVERLPSLPMAFTDLDVLAPLPPAQPFLAIVEPHEGGGAQTRLRLTAQTPDGAVCLRMIASVIKSPALASKFGAQDAAVSSDVC